MTMAKESIHLINIEEEFSRLWDAEQGPDKIRACLFNLIIYVPKSGRSSFYDSLIKSVISKFPCRVILITADEEGDYLETSVATETITQGELQIVCEIIRINVGGSLKERVPFLVLPHILPDLPLYLLWTKDPSLESTTLPRLERFAKRIILDPERVANLQSYAQSVLKMMERFHCMIGDLNWSALGGWRKIFFSVFDTLPALQALSLSKKIRISYSAAPSHPHSEIEAAYLQGWLAAQLGWKFESYEKHEGNFRLAYTGSSHETIFLLTPRTSELPPGSLIDVEMESSQDGAHWTFKRHPETRQVFIQYSDSQRCDLPSCTFLAGAQEGQEIIDEIFYQSTGEHYRNMLQTLSQIPWEQVS